MPLWAVGSGDFAPQASVTGSWTSFASRFAPKS